MDALAAVHREGIIHRDVTPDNIVLTRDGGVKLLDFGAARYSLGEKSQSLDVVLKAGYAPKEQYIRRGRQGPYTDVYSLAACFYATITGYLPPESLERMDYDDIIAPSAWGIQIPRELEDVIFKGLEVQPSDRYQSMEEFREALNAAIGKNPAPAQGSFSVNDIRAPSQASDPISFPGPSGTRPLEALETGEKPAVRPAMKPLQLGLIAAGCCTILLVCLAVGGWLSRSHYKAPTYYQSKDLPAANDLIDAEQFSSLHSSEDFVVVVPRNSDLMGMEDLFGRSIGIDASDAYVSYDQTEHTQLFWDIIDFYNLDEFYVFDNFSGGLYGAVMSGEVDTAIMNCDSALECLFETNGRLRPEVRVFDWTASSSGTQTEPSAPEESGDGDVIDLTYYQLTIPASWRGRVEWEAEEYSGIDFLGFYHSISREKDMGGFLFSIGLFERASDYEDDPSYEVLGTINVSPTKEYTVVVLYPTDVQFSDEDMGDYLSVSEDIPSVLDTFQIK